MARALVVISDVFSDLFFAFFLKKKFPQKKNCGPDGGRGKGQIVQPDESVMRELNDMRLRTFSLV